MKRRRIVTAAVGLLGLGAVAAAALWFASAPVTLEKTAFADLKPGDPVKGEQVFWASGCASCHASPELGAGASPEQRLVLTGGHVLKSDFGNFIAPNISPSEQGLKDWSLEEFANAMMRGIGRDGEHLYPSFPYTSYAKMKLQDVSDLYSFLQTLPASDQQSKAQELSFPFNIRRGIGLWKQLYLSDTPVVDLSTADAQVQRGQYLVEAMGHCGECHTPRNAIGGLDQSQWLAGAYAAGMDQNGRRPVVPNITTGEGGIGSWSTTDIAYGLESGFTPDFDSMGGAMADVIGNTKHLAASDREAIAAYLKAIPAHPDGYKKQ